MYGLVPVRDEGKEWEGGMVVMKRTVFQLVACLTYLPTLKIEAVNSSETSVLLHPKRRYSSEEIHAYRNSCSAFGPFLFNDHENRKTWENIRIIDTRCVTLSSPFVWDIFRSGTYFTNYTRDTRRNACRFPYTSVILSDFNQTWNVQTNVNKSFVCQ
jgi:hypothetical protein